MPALLVVLLVLLLLQTAAADAAFRPGPAPRPSKLRNNKTTEITVTSLGPGQAVTGFIANADNPFDPVVEGYPSSNPTSGFTGLNEGFAGVIHGTPVGGGGQLSLYCIDILTPTSIGYGYGLGTWDAVDVPNVGYVAQLLNSYYPNKNEPSTFPDGTPMSLNQTAAAVQAAIWFFSDRYVLSTEDQLHNAVAAIVDAVILKGPLVQPPPPTLTLTPAQLSGGAGSALGPFTVATNHSPVAVTATGAIMYSNRVGTKVLGDGTTASVQDGQKIWLRSGGGTAAATLQATSTATVPSGNVYIYSGNVANVNTAQKLILAETTTLKTTVQATAEFRPSGSLVVKKTIAGPAAGSQGPVVIQVKCDDGVRRLPFIIPAGAPAGDKSRAYRHIAFGTTCTVIETSNGSTVGTEVVVTGDGQEVPISAGRIETVHITDTYSHPPKPGPGSGSLVVAKTIAGPSAGHQGQVTIAVTCNGLPLSPVFTIDGNTAAGSASHRYDGISPGSVCTVTETRDGATATVRVSVSGNDQKVTVPGGQVATVNVMDVYEDTLGSLRVTKTIAGPAAHRHGHIAILVACGGPLHVYAFVIPAHTGAGSVTRQFDGIPAGSRCTVSEAADGHTSTVSVAASGRQRVTVPANGTASAHLTDRFAVRAQALPPPRVTG